VGALPGSAAGSNAEFASKSKGGDVCDELRLKNFMGLVGKCSLVEKPTGTVAQIRALVCTSERARKRRPMRS
jgi:hypothetical protein